MVVWDGDYFVLNGLKQFIILGDNGGLFVVFVVMDKDVGCKGIIVFLVEWDMFGYNVVWVEKKLGIVLLDICQLLFEDMCILVENMLGVEGEGYKIVLVNFESGWIGIVVQVVGMV